MTKPKHCLSLLDLDASTIQQCLQLAQQIKANPEAYVHSLEGKSIALLFEKPSLRTRVSFEVGIHQLGGHAVYLDANMVGPGQRESVQDIAANLACWTHAIVARVFQHDTLQQLSTAGISVVNALCDIHHPCQTLADLLTLQEVFGEDLSVLKVAYLGDGNNVCQSLMLGAAALNMPLQVVTPKTYGPSKQIMQTLDETFKNHQVTLLNDPAQLGPVDALYTDTWISMGEQDSAEKKQYLQPFQLNQQLLEASGATAVMHCLPAHRGDEITDELMDGEHSVILRQAENRMHAQKALLHYLFNGFV
ncbi:ornithine carbamoyltransferase [Aliidiomarina minuta]|uniref:Ornithine carbamoyltransferase n=1 Tax=Aliidiomarina minuta TaxID=880057 RepID=A0A432W6E9_9GAMM|nr:ornithine carbamoyltransferase [Aliidiomarina minuta]RUO25654.1 ornithine carbamoyltransferase [Aliidiomarina minuta]